MTDETTDQAPEQSVEERLAARFGLPAAPVEEAPAESAPDLFDFEYEGEKFQLPTKLKDALMQKADYTRKTQELADHRRTYEHLRDLAKASQSESAFRESVQPLQQEISVIEAYLQQASKLDWAQMSTDQILRHKVELDGVKERRDALKADIEAKRAKFQEDTQRTQAEMRTKAREVATKSIPNFDEHADQTLRAYAKSEGLNEQEIESVLLDPRSFRVLWKAAQFEKVQSQVKSVPEKTKTLKVGPGSERMPPETAQRLNFLKAMKGAKTSGQKAGVIEQRLMGMFDKR